MDLFGEEREPTMLDLEEWAWRRGYSRIAGIDEAGRGALAGPVVAAAVILPEGVPLTGVDDSKKLTPAKREELYGLIMEKAVAVGVGCADHATIDRVNILEATLIAMKDAVRALTLAPDYLLIDGITKISFPLPQKTVKKGDALSLSIAAASIVAKVTRDRLMTAYESQFPGYGLAEHKGYGCAAHRDAIARFGPTAIHRVTFSGVREYLPGAAGGMV